MDALPPRANASPTRELGDRGSFVFAWQFDVGAAHDPSAPLDKVSGTAILSPSLEAFVVRRLSLGVAMGVGFQSGPGAQASQISVTPRVGYVFPLARDLLFWPRAGFELESRSVSTPNTTTRIWSDALSFYAPLSLVPLEHIEVGFGPTFAATLATRETGGKEAPLGTTFGLAVDLGGWL
ncbi:MAG: hypothetical protein ACRELY_11995 [Polyangiaceae bacterium]